MRRRGIPPEDAEKEGHSVRVPVRFITEECLVTAVIYTPSAIRSAISFQITGPFKRGRGQPSPTLIRLSSRFWPDRPTGSLRLPLNARSTREKNLSIKLKALSAEFESSLPAKKNNFYLRGSFPNSGKKALGL